MPPGIAHYVSGLQHASCGDEGRAKPRPRTKVGTEGCFVGRGLDQLEWLPREVGTVAVARWLYVAVTREAGHRRTEVGAQFELTTGERCRRRSGSPPTPGPSPERRRLRSS